MPRALVLRGSLVVLASMAASTPRLQAQFVAPPPPAAYALTRVTLVRADGTRDTGVTIVVRGTFLESLGRGVEPPPDAEVLEGDSLFVYPGLIDAEGAADFEFPEPEVNRDELEPWDAPRAVQGFTPHRRVVDALTATGASLAASRQKGIVAAAVLPTGPVMPGRGAFLVFRGDAEASQDLVVTPELGPVFSFRGARGAYPATTFAVSAFIRQSFEDAAHHGRLVTQHRRDPHQIEVPRWDPDYEVLRRAAAKEFPVYFVADQSEEIRVVLRLADELGFQPIVVGGAEAWRVADELARRDVPVLLSLDFPEPKQWKPKAAGDSTAADTLDAAAGREKRDLERRYRNAQRLAEAGVRFAFSSGGGEGDLRAGVRKAIEYGLSEERALAAVTSVPAELFGVRTIAAIEPGLPATFVAADGPLFGEKTRIRYTFVEGTLERGAATRPAGKGADSATVDVSGLWRITIDAGGEAISGTVTLDQEGSAFTGTMTLDFGPAQVQDGVVSGTEVTFAIAFTMGGQSMTAEARGTVEGDRMTGSGTSPQGDFTFRATRGTPENGGAR